ncbi:MAG: Ig-like domain-containing protein, partial [Vicinamibacterales bacterium]
TVFTAPATITISASAADTDGSIARVDFYSGATVIGTATTAPYSMTWSSVPAGRYSLTAVATDNLSASTTSAAVNVSVNGPSSLPAGWTDVDVGATGAAGSASYASPTFTVTGAGADVWGTADAFHYAYMSLTGDGTIVARVVSIQPVSPWTKAGVMIRNSLSPSAAYAYMLVAASAAKGAPFQRRTADGASAASTSGSQSTAPYWVKLVRAGNMISGYESTDGVSWTLVDGGTFAMSSTVLIGLAVSSHVAGTNASATFDNVSVSAGMTGASGLPSGWADADAGATGATGGAQSSSDTFTVTGAGADVWGTADAFNFAYTPLSGDGTIVARVASIQAVNAWTKAGVMIRTSLSPSAAYAFMLVASSAEKGVPFQRRTADGASAVSTPGSQSTAPRWVKLVRSGDTISGYESADGVSWTPVGTDTFTMDPDVLVGLAVSSHVAGTDATATFDHVSITQ